MGADLSAAHWLLRYSVRLREREHEASELRTFAVRPQDSTEPLLLPPAPPPPSRRRRRAVAPVVEVVEATEVDVPVLVESFAPPPVDDAATDVDAAVRWIFESARAPKVTTDVDTSITDRMPPIQEAEWTPVKVEITAASPRAVVVVTRDPSPSVPFVSIPDEANVVTPTSVSDLRGSAVSRAPRVSFALSLTPPPMPELPRLPPPAVLLDPPTPPPAVDAQPASAPAPAPRAVALPAELPNPWASTSLPKALPPAVAPLALLPMSTTTEVPTVEAAPRSARAVLVRAVVLLALSAAVGMGTKLGIARFRHPRTPAPAVVAPAVTAAPVATADVLEGDLEVRAPAGAPISVDGKVRGSGPLATMKLAPGYHTLRVGQEKTAIVEIHRGTLATVDLTK